MFPSLGAIQDLLFFQEFLPSPGVNYLEEDSGCGSATCGSNTPSGTSSIPDWTDSGLSPVISNTEGT